MIEGALPTLDPSPTAATVGNNLYGPSGAMTYRVRMQTAVGGITEVDVDASTGDEAAIKGLEKFLGGRVMHVEPAPQRTREKLTVKGD